MSGRFVRASKYRHVFGEPAAKEKGCFLGINAATDGDGCHIAGNQLFIAYATTGGGAPLVVLKANAPGRLPARPPCVNVHHSKVFDFEFSPFLPNLVATGAEDNLVKLTLVPVEGLKEDITQATATLEGHQKRIAFVRFHPTANNVLASASLDQTVRVWDVERSSALFSWEGAADAINSMEWNRSGSMLAVTTKDKVLRIFDPRSKAAAQQADTLEGSKPAKAFWADALNLVGVVGFSRTASRQITLIDVRKMERLDAPIDIDQSAGVILPFFDHDTSVLFLAGKGDGGIKYYELTSEAPYCHFLSEFRSPESQKGCAFTPKLACEVMTCEIARALRLMRDYIQPVSFLVPRKSELFQADIFPDTFAGVPALSAAEWAGGANKPPVLVPANPAARPAAAGAARPVAQLHVQKSAAELQRELDAARARIAELEAEVAALKKA